MNICHTGIILTFFQLVTGKIEYVNQKMSWKEASQYCKTRYNGSLASSTEYNKGVHSNASVWISTVTTLTPWMELQGCFSIPENTTYTSRTHLINNTPGLCFLHCNQTPYIAVRDTECFCMTTHTMTSVNLVAFKNCSFQQFNGELTEFKGGNFSVSIFKKVYPPSRFGNRSGHCLEFSCPNKTATYVPANCSEGNHGVCFDYNGGSDILVQVGSQLITSWEEASNFCKTRGRSLYNTTKAVSFCQHSRDSFERWTNVYQAEVNIDQKLINHSSILRCGRRMTNLHGNSSNHTNEFVNCTSPLNTFACTVPNNKTREPPTVPSLITYNVTLHKTLTSLKVQENQTADNMILPNLSTKPRPMRHTSEVMLQGTSTVPDSSSQEICTVSNAAVLIKLTNASYIENSTISNFSEVTTTNKDTIEVKPTISVGVIAAIVCSCTVLVLIGTIATACLLKKKCAPQRIIDVQPENIL